MPNGNNFAFDTARWYTADGRMHISRSHITKAAVNPYYGREIPGWDVLGLDPNKVYQMLRAPEELRKAVQTFRILPILNKHIAVLDFDGMEEAEKKKYIVGSTGSEVEFLDPFLDADTCIWEANAIVGIETDKVREFSCSYRYEPVMTTGDYEGVRYDGIMTRLQGNHLALVESGRAGNEVLAADQNLEKNLMARTKLGNALIVAVTTAFPKVGLAFDENSELGKMLAGAKKKSFDKTKALKLIVAMDAEMDPKQPAAVMDALVDVDKDEPEPKKKDKADDAEPDHPKGCMCADCKTARDAEPDDDDDEEEKRKKAAKDKAAKDRAKDADKVSREDMKGAMDSLSADLRAQFLAVDEAKRDVRAVVGDVIAMDSAEAIYAFALDHLKVDHAGVTGAPALKAIFKVASAAPAAVPSGLKLAMDSASSVEKMFPGASRIRVM
jgi:hypothetical protein